MKQSGGWDDLASSTLGHCSALLVLPTHPSAFVLYLMSRGLIYGSIPCHGTSYAGCGCGQLLACVCCTQSLIYGLIPPQVVAVVETMSSYKWNNHPTGSVCVVPIIRLRLGRGLIYGGSPCSAHPLLTFGFWKWSTCTCGFIKYQLNQSSKNWQIILETAVALFWYQGHASILLICSIVAFNLNLWCVIFFRGCGQK